MLKNYVFRDYKYYPFYFFILTSLALAIYSVIHYLDLSNTHILNSYLFSAQEWAFWRNIVLFLYFAIYLPFLVLIKILRRYFPKIPSLYPGFESLILTPIFILASFCPTYIISRLTPMINIMQEDIVLMIFLSVLIPSYFLVWRNWGDKISLEELMIKMAKQLSVVAVSTILFSIAIFFMTDSDPGTAVAAIAVLMIEILLLVVAFLMILLKAGFTFIHDRVVRSHTLD